MVSTTIGVKPATKGWPRSQLFLAKSVAVKIPSLHFQPGRPSSVFANFLRYLLGCVERFIKDAHHNGSSLWDDGVAGRAHYILAHPNAWEGSQQSQLRQAAVIAGFITNAAADKDRVQFVTEGKASLHFCIQQGLGEDLLKKVNLPSQTV